MLDVAKLPVGGMQTNCYIIKTSENNAVIIDPGADEERIFRWLENNSLKPTKILLTHGHFDHINAVEALKKRYGASVYIHSADECMLSDENKSLAYLFEPQTFFPTSADVLLSDGDLIEQDGVFIKVLHSPGHSAGSACFICEDCFFAGDTLFAGSAGRTDFYSGSYKVQKETLSMLKQIEEDYRLFCGHGEDSTLRTEQETNPFMP